MLFKNIIFDKSLKELFIEATVVNKINTIYKIIVRIIFLLNNIVNIIPDIFDKTIKTTHNKIQGSPLMKILLYNSNILYNTTVQLIIIKMFIFILLDIKNIFFLIIKH